VRLIQVGALDPGAHEDLKTTLFISHPHEDVVYKQGSYLDRQSIADLEEMQTHQDLLVAQVLVKERVMQLVNAGARLRASRASRMVMTPPGHGRGSMDTPVSSGTGADHMLSKFACVSTCMDVTMRQLW
jgi:hypothetical protein